MKQIDPLSSNNLPIGESNSTSGSTHEPVSDADAVRFQQQMDATSDDLTEEQLMEQYNDNFRTISYLTMKRIFSYVEDEIKERQ